MKQLRGIALLKLTAKKGVSNSKVTVPQAALTNVDSKATHSITEVGLQSKLCQTVRQLSHKQPGLLLMVEPNDEVTRHWICTNDECS